MQCFNFTTYIYNQLIVQPHGEILRIEHILRSHEVEKKHRLQKDALQSSMTLLLGIVQHV